MKPILLIILVYLCLSGCVGYSAHGNYELTVASPNISNVKGKLVVDKSASYSTDERVKSNIIYKNWGKPDEIVKTENDVEFWSYSFNNRWNGVYLFVVVPIPLFLPVGSDQIIFEVSKGVITQAKVKSNGFRSEYLCGIVPLNYHNIKFGCNYRSAPKDKIANEYRANTKSNT